MSLNAFTIFACCTTVSGFVRDGSLAMALARIFAPMGTKNEKKIQTANAARAEVAVLRNNMENRIATPSQKDI